MARLCNQILFCSIGTVFEWYEFTVFLYFTPIIALLFFPRQNPFQAMMGSLAIFSAGFMMRPIGAVIFGHLGDKWGRKYTLLITIFLMAIATTCIGLIPTSNGFATVFLVLCRMLQGLASSGEYPTSLALLVEQNSQKHKIFITSFALFATAIGSFSGALVYALLTKTLSPKTLLDFAWRIPFLLGLPIGLLGYYLRRHVFESHAFEKIKQEGLCLSYPLFRLFSAHLKTLLLILIIYILYNTAIYLDIGYFGNYTLNIHKINVHELSWLNVAITLTSAVAILFFGFLADYVNKKILLLLGVFLTCVFIYPFIYFILHGNFWLQLLAQMMIAVFLGMFAGPLAFIAANTFPTAVRCSALSIAVNIAGSLFGGTAPFIFSWLTKISGSPMVPAYYILFLGMLALLSSVYLFRRKS